MLVYYCTKSSCELACSLIQAASVASHTLVSQVTGTIRVDQEASSSEVVVPFRTCDAVSVCQVPAVTSFVSWSERAEVNDCQRLEQNGSSVVRSVLNDRVEGAENGFEDNLVVDDLGSEPFESGENNVVLEEEVVILFEEASDWLEVRVFIVDDHVSFKDFEGGDDVVVNFGLRS